MATNNATVKAVISGDTLVLVGKATSGPPKEITVTLASLNAPRISRGPQQSTEEPFAFEAREYLRKLCLGKAVEFRIIYCVTSIEKYFADVDLIDPNGGEPISLGKSVASAGWAVVKESRDEKNSAIHTDIYDAHNKAKQSKLGMFTTDAKVKTAATRQPKWSPTANELQTLFDKYKNKATKAIIEYVRDGSSFRAYIVDAQTYISFSLAGVIAPRVNSTGKSDANDDVESDTKTKPTTTTTSSAELYAPQSRYFTELRMLCREIDLVMEQYDTKSGLILGSILHPKGNIAVELVKNGLARISDRNIEAIKKETVLALLHAEQEAKVNRRFIWQDYEPPRPSPHNKSGPKIIIGVCIEANSSDTITIIPLPATQSYTSPIDTFDFTTKSEEMKITLSSIKTPRISPNPRTISESEPWALECKEFLRSKLVGKRVSILIDYEKFLQPPAPKKGKNDTNKSGNSNNNNNNSSKAKDAAASKEDKEGEENDIINDDDVTTIINTTTQSVAAIDTSSTKAASTINLRYFGSVKILNTQAPSAANKSINVQLIQEGLAKCIRHRRDEPKSIEYDHLLILEYEAAIKGKGIHGKEVASMVTAASKINDVSTDSKKAKALFPLLPKTTLRGIVEHVYSGARVKVYIPSESCTVQLSLNQVRCPLLARNIPGQPARPAEPFSDEARKFTRFHLNQRSVEISLEDIDKNGVTLGRIFYYNDQEIYQYTGIGLWENKKRFPYACTLLQSGLARLDKYSIQRATDQEYIKGLQDIEMIAKDKRIGLWSIESNHEVEIEVTENEENIDENGENTTDGNTVTPTTATTTSTITTHKWTVGNVVNVKLSDIIDGATFYVNDEDSEPIIESLTTDLTTYAKNASYLTANAAKNNEVKKGTLVAALFEEPAEEEGEIKQYWCRARIDDFIMENDIPSAYVTYIDYGNTGKVGLTKLVLLTGSTADAKLINTPPQARSCKLAFLKAPSSAASADDWYAPLASMSGCMLHDLAWGRKMKVLVLGTDTDNTSKNAPPTSDKNNNNRNRNSMKSSAAANTIYHVALYPESFTLPTEVSNVPDFSTTMGQATTKESTSAKLAPISISVNEEILSEGLATISSKMVRALKKGPRRGSRLNLLSSTMTTTFLDKLEAAQSLARKDHLNLFRYGDPGGDSDDEGDDYGNRREKDSSTKNKESNTKPKDTNKGGKK